MISSKKKYLTMAILSAISSMSFMASVSAEDVTDSKLENYDLENVVIEEKAEEQTYDDKYIRTGGDVDIITSEDIEKHHYTSVADAIKRLPGVEVQDVGYKAGF